VHTGVLAALPPPVVTSGGITRSYVAIDLVYAFFVLAVPTFFTASILAQLRKKQRDLEARTEALIEAGKQKSQFMANITHELRTPIHGICGLSDLVEGGIYGPVTDKQREATRGIKRSARSLLQLIDDLLELSRADAGKLAFRPDDVDVREVVEQVVASVRWMQGTKAVSIETELADDVPHVFTDSRKLGQIVLNLLSNAVKFTGEDGRIVVRARRDGDAAVALEVEDTGIGIPESEQGRIFEEFRQVDGSAERRFGGIGLGLALVKRLADAMHATVSLKSEEGVGSTFTVVVPVRVAMDEVASRQTA
jgi:signal transduction histidine kinase